MRLLFFSFLMASILVCSCNFRSNQGEGGEQGEDLDPEKAAWGGEQEAGGILVRAEYKQFVLNHDYSPKCAFQTPCGEFKFVAVKGNLPGLKSIRIDGIEPNQKTLKSGSTYILRLKFSAMTNQNLLDLQKDGSTGLYVDKNEVEVLREVK